MGTLGVSLLRTSMRRRSLTGRPKHNHLLSCSRHCRIESSIWFSTDGNTAKYSGAPSMSQAQDSEAMTFVRERIALRRHTVNMV